MVNCDPRSQLVHRLIGEAENGKPTANIFSNGGTFSKVGAQWSSTECWGGNWKAVAETAIIFMGNVFKATRYMVVRDCQTRVNPANYETGLF